MTPNSKQRHPPTTARRVRHAVERSSALRGEVPSVEREVGRLPRKRRTEASRLSDKIEHEARIVWNRLQKLGGVMPYNDHTPAEEIHAVFGLSKKAFKRGLGRLYRQHRVEILPRSVRATTAPRNPKEKEENAWRKPVSQS
jgi:hypothetical protein